MIQFLLGIITIAGVLFLLDNRTRRLGLLIALPPVVIYAIHIIGFPHWLSTVVALILPAWTIWAFLGATPSCGAPARHLFPTPSLKTIQELQPAIITSIVVVTVLMSSISRRAPSEGARALVGHRMVNHRGAWTYQPSHSQSDSMPQQAFDIYFTPYGICRSSLNGVNFDGRLLHEQYRNNIHLDCLPNNTRLYAEFKIEGEVLSIHNLKDDAPFRLQFVKKNWGPGWYDSFLPSFLTK